MAGKQVETLVPVMSLICTPGALQLTGLASLSLGERQQTIDSTRPDPDGSIRCRYLSPLIPD